MKIQFKHKECLAVGGGRPETPPSGELRDKFSQTVAPRFGVNAPVIAIRLDRDGIWPAA